MLADIKCEIKPTLFLEPAIFVSRLIKYVYFYGDTHRLDSSFVLNFPETKLN